MYAELFNRKLGALRRKIFGNKPSRVRIRIKIDIYKIKAIRIGSIFLYLAFSILLLGLLQLAIFYDIEGWDMVTSIYFIVVTLTTIGYGDYGKFDDSTQVQCINYPIKNLPSKNRNTWIRRTCSSRQLFQSSCFSLHFWSSTALSFSVGQSIDFRSNNIFDKFGCISVLHGSEPFLQW